MENKIASNFENVGNQIRLTSLKNNEIMLGKILRKQREHYGLSQSKLANIAGIEQSRLSAFELEKHDLNFEDKKAIKFALESLNEKKIKRLKKKRYRNHIKDGTTIASRCRRSYEKTARNYEYLNLLSYLEKQFHSENTAGLKAISFFAGCGGLCYGIKAAGFEIVATNELQQAYKDIYSDNFPNANYLTDNITEITDKEVNKIISAHKEIDLMIGGPPCQGFSLAGKRDINDKRNNLFQNYLHIANLIRPKVILMENVRLLISMKDSNGKYVSNRILDTFKSIGYTCSFFNVNAKDYRVPQHRERVIFIGIRNNLSLSPSIPPALCGTTNDLFSHKYSYFTFGDAVSDLDYLESGEESSDDKHHKTVRHPEHVIKWLIDVPEGKSAHENKDKSLRPLSGYNTTYKRQVWNEPGGTVGTTFAMISGCRNVHPIATRSLTTREALRLQSFPDSFILNGKMGDIRTAIGNAVPPLLAYALGKHIKDTYIL